MNHRELIIVLNDAFFKNRHEDKRYRKGWVDAFRTVEDEVNAAFAREAARLAASTRDHTRADRERMMGSSCGNAPTAATVTSTP